MLCGLCNLGYDIGVNADVARIIQASMELSGWTIGDLHRISEIFCVSRGLSVPVTFPIGMRDKGALIATITLSIEKKSTKHHKLD